MEIERTQPAVEGPEGWFTGEVRMEPIVRPRNGSPLEVVAVRFAPGARTAWHAHDGGQTLYVTEGEGRVQARGGPTITIVPGDVVHTPSGEWHWHGAAPDHTMTHLSFTVGEKTWGDHATDDE